MRLNFLACLTLLAAMSCNVSNDTVTPGARIVDFSGLKNSATRVYLTSSPTRNPEVQALWLTISSVAVHTSATASIDDPDWQERLLIPPYQDNFQKFGVNYNVDIMDHMFAPGTYRQLRLSLEDAGVDLISGPSLPVQLVNARVVFPLGTGLNVVSDANYGIMMSIDADASLQGSGVNWTMDTQADMLEAFQIRHDGRTVAVAN